MDFLDKIRSRAEARRRGSYLGGRIGKQLCSLQHDQNIANADGATVRADINNALGSLFSLSSGATEPSTKIAYQLWADTTSGTLKQRNAANSGWLVRGSLAETFVVSRASNTILGVADFAKTFVATAAFTQTLTAAATLGDGWFCHYVNTGASTSVTFDPNGAETINGATTLAFGPGESGTIFCNGSSFQIIGRSRYAGAVASGRNIAARTNAATPNTKLDISADEVQLKDANGNVKVVSTVAVTIDFGTTGANGIDTGAQAASTWYYGWVIAKEDGTVAGLGSTSATAPTMPSGYTYKALLTASRSDASVHFLPYRQTGNWAYYPTLNNVNATSTSTTEQTVSVSTFVPPIALAYKVGSYLSYNASGGGAMALDMQIRIVSGFNFQRLPVVATTNGITASGQSVDLPNLSQQFIWIANNNTNVLSASVNFDVLGFKLPLGGE